MRYTSVIIEQLIIATGKLKIRFFGLLFFVLVSSIVQVFANVNDSISDFTLDCDNPPGPAEIVTVPGLFCEMYSIDLDANDIYVGNGLWTIESGFGTILDPTNPHTQLVDLPFGSVVVLRWTVSNEDCPDVFDEITITVGHPAPEITSNAPLCEGATMILTILDPSPFTTFNWFDPNNNLVGTTSTLTIPNVTPSMQGVYTVFVIDEYGCEVSSSKGVEILQSDEANAGTDQLLCTETTYNLNANTPGFGTGMWSVLSGTATFADATDPTTLVSDLSTGANILVWTITSYFSCPSSSDTILLTVGHPAPEITSNGPLCEGSTMVLEVVDPAPFTTFNWFDPNNNLVGTTSTLTIPNVNPAMQGVYTVFATDEYGCEVSASKGVEILQSDEADAGTDQLLCTERTYTLSANTPSFGTGMWSVLSGTATFADATDPLTTVSDLSPGESKLVWTITSYFTCPASSDTITLTVGHSAPDISSNAPICEGSTLILEVIDPAPFNSFNWYDPSNNLVGTTSTLTIPNVNPFMQGVYTVFVTDEYGCEISASKGVEILQSDEADAGTDQLLCTETTYTLSANTPSFGTGMWSVLSGTATFADATDPLTTVSDLSPGESKLVWTITSYFTCPASSDTIIITVGHPAPEITSNGPLCEGSTMVLEVADPAPFTTFNWFDPNNILVGTNSTLTIPNVNPSMQGVYTLFVTDEYGCEVSSSKGVEILQSDEANAGTDQLLCTETTYNLSANTPSFGTGIWSVISGTATFADATDPMTVVSDLSTGENKLVWTITSYFTCPSSSDTITLTVGHPAPEITSNGPLCEGSTMILTIVDPSPFTTFNWFDPNNNLVGTTSTLTIPNVNPSMQGVYTVFVTDEYGCEVSASKGVEILQSDEADAGTDQLLCTETTYTLSANAPSFGTGMWSVISGTATFVDATEPLTTVSDLSTGENILVWTITSYFTCPASSDTITLTVGHPAPDISSNAPICEGSTLILEVIDPAPFTTFNWFDPNNNLVGTTSTLEIQNVQLSMAGIYTVKTIDEYNCEKLNSIEVIIEAAEIANAGLDQLLCSGNSATMEGNSPIGGSGLWTIINGSGTIEHTSNPTTQVSDLGIGENIFVWSITPNSNCPSVSDTVILTVGHSAPYISSNAPICEGSTLILEVIDPAHFTTFNWYDPSNNSVGTTSTVTIPNTTPDMQGVYTIFVTDDYGCENSAAIDIDIQEVLLADAGNDQLVCNNTTTALDAETPSGGMGTWSVTQGSGNFEDINDPHTLVTGLSIGQNSFLWTVDPENNCSSSSDEVLITVGLTNISVSSNSPICQGATLILTGEGNNIVSYTWNGPSGVTGSGQELSINSTLPEDSGIYQLSVTDIFGCSSTTTAEIIIEPNPIVNAGIDQFACSDAEIILNANLPAGTVGHWNIVEGNGVISDLSDPFSLFTNQAPFENVTLSWTLISSIGCTDIDTVLLNYIDQSPPAFAGVDFAACQSEPFLILNATPPGNGQGSWSVFEGMADFEDESNPASKITNFSPGTAGTLVLQWKITDQCHLGLPSAEDYITITIDQPSGPALLLTQDVNLCQTTELIIAADDNYLGQGEWTLLSGSGTIANSSNPMTLITNLSIGIPITLQWAVVNGVCPVKSATLNIQVDPLPDAALVGLDQQICNETDFSLNASPVDVGQGIWRIVEGIGNIQDEKDPASHVTGLVPGSDVSLVWEVSSGICPVSIDTVVIRNNALPDEARLGADLQICNAQVLNISANEPTSGSGMWSVIEGSVHVNSPTDANTFLDGLVSDSLIKVTWTISNGVCPSSIDTLQIINYQLPDGAHAGDDIMACVDSVWLSAQSILVGSGIWEIVQGDGQIANKKSNQTLLSDLPNNESVILTWTVSNGVCPIQQDTIVISTAKNFLEAHAGDDLYPCSAESILLNAESAPEGTTAAWKIISGPGQVRNPSASSSWIDDLISGQQTTVAWTLSEGICPEVADTIIIDNLDGANLNANFLINQAACLGDSLAIIDVSNIPESSDIEFIWTSNGDVISNERDPVIIFDESGLKNIQLEIRIGACSSMSPVKEINILDCLIEDQDSTVKYNNVSAFPNPTTGKVRVEIEQIEGESLLRLYDAAGRLLLDEKLIGNSISKELNLEQPGFYFIQIINPKFEKVIKILKL